MPTKSVLGHVALRLGTHPENLATECLAYIASESGAAKRALVSFLRHLGVSVPDIALWESQQIGPDGSIPDLIGTDVDRRPVAILEAKFWAGLTDYQPVSYLKRLPLDSDAVLLIVAPAVRVALLWPELLQRCREAHLELGTERAPSPEVVIRAVGPRHALALCSWRALLGHLLQGVNLEGDVVALADIIQLQGICDRMDDDAFLPLDSDELTASIGKRVLQYCRLVDDVVPRLVVDGLATWAPNARKSASAGAYYCPVVINGYCCYLQVNAEHWVRRRPTPIWLSIRDGDWKPARLAKQALSELQAADPPRALDGGDDMLVPIRLPVGVERPAVVDSVIAQITEVAQLLAAHALPVPGVPTPPMQPGGATGV